MGMVVRGFGWRIDQLPIHPSPALCGTGERREDVVMLLVSVSRGPRLPSGSWSHLCSDDCTFPHQTFHVPSDRTFCWTAWAGLGPASIAGVGKGAQKGPPGTHI